MNFRSHLTLVATAASAILISSTARAQVSVSGAVSNLMHFEGHTGILVRLDRNMKDPQGCGRTDWYIIPDSSPHAQFVQSMLLTAQETRRVVYLTINGCLQGFPVVWSAEKIAP
jgi:hypothetical protein